MISRTSRGRPYQRIDIIQHIERRPPVNAIPCADNQELQRRETSERRDYAHGRGPDYSPVSCEKAETINSPRNYT